MIRRSVMEEAEPELLGGQILMRLENDEADIEHYEKPLQ